MKFAQRLKELREKKGLSQQELATIIGKSKSLISMYESGGRVPPFETQEAIADYFNVSLDCLMGRTDYDDFDVFSLPGIAPLSETAKKPLLGIIPCGEPILAVENIDEYIDVPQNAKCDFVLKCKGDSMIEARINDGDYVYVRQQPDVNDGEIAAVLIDNEATLKRVYKKPNRVILRAANIAFDDMIYEGEKLNNFRILGKVVGFTSFNVR